MRKTDIHPTGKNMRLSRIRRIRRNSSPSRKEAGHPSSEQPQGSRSPISTQPQRSGQKPHKCPFTKERQRATPGRSRQQSSPLSQRASSLPALPKGEPRVCAAFTKRVAGVAECMPGCKGKATSHTGQVTSAEQPSQSASKLAARSPVGRAFGLCGFHGMAVLRKSSHCKSTMTSSGRLKMRGMCICTWVERPRLTISSVPPTV